jgi:polyphenol oxidase
MRKQPRIHNARHHLADQWIHPDWPASVPIHACTTTRQGGASTPPYEGLNLANRVGDSVENVRANRQWLVEHLSLPSQPYWLKQVHGNRVIDPAEPSIDPYADGVCTSAKGTVCAVLTADCLPVLLCDRAGTRVAALHCGWRGLVRGLLQAGLDQLQRPPEEILAWLGPAIGAQAYEVGEEVYSAFSACDPPLAQAFTPSRSGRWLLDLYGIARRLLKGYGVDAIYGGQHCTYRESQLFFSHRRDGTTGRMASLIWIAAEQE